MTTTLDWYGCSTFRLTTNGLTIFLDAYIDRAANAPGTGLSARDVTECDWILVGHSHFDHLYGADAIVANTNATLIASYESVRMMEEAGVPARRMICVAGGETIDLGAGVTVEVFPSLHSCVWSHAKMVQADEPCLGDLGVNWHDRQERIRALGSFLSTALAPESIAHVAETGSGTSPRGDGGALVFLIRTPDGSVLFQDTSGHWTGVLERVRPDVAIIAAAGRGNIDGQPIQGSLADFTARQVALLEPKRVVFGHHDDWLPGFSVATDMAPVRAAVLAQCPEVEILEPGYLDATPLW